MADDERPQRHPREQGVVAAEELDIDRDERVARIESGRYVIATGDATAPDPAELESETESDSDAASERDTEGDRPEDEPETDDDAAPVADEQDKPTIKLPKDPRKRAIVARKLIAERVGAANADHAFAVTALVDGSVEQHESVSNEVTDVFRSLLLWYAEVVGDDSTPLDEVLGILLLASEVQVTYPGRAIEALAAANGLKRTDSIGDLLDAVDESGASFPP
ncbi:hypothetical protein C453_08393 [Haloferax elongans ATCC BAA-1513]|uniref:Uncharacterized protein n=1 Tax=Haloferax elongans ATCC BAA-1513 TaxID=1230453 RepID=M0HMK4_HALEO|nr:hypothetical protein [Haloferax elongans]ELZ85820.1 hypothetical protein C453_08393 [Haloferax elongans ATCC BAA-1513]